MGNGMRLACTNRDMPDVVSGQAEFTVGNTYEIAATWDVKDLRPKIELDADIDSRWCTVLDDNEKPIGFAIGVLPKFFETTRVLWGTHSKAGFETSGL